MTREEMIEQLENTILLIKQNGKDWWDERDIPILKEAIQALQTEQIEVEAAKIQKAYNEGFEACRQALYAGNYIFIPEEATKRDVFNAFREVAGFISSNAPTFRYHTVKEIEEWWNSPYNQWKERKTLNGQFSNTTDEI